MPKLDTGHQGNFPSRNPMNLESNCIKVNSMSVSSALYALAWDAGMIRGRETVPLNITDNFPSAEFMGIRSKFI